MKIDLPVTIIFDCQETNQSAIMRSSGHVVCTLRFETDGDGRDAVLFGSYPPNEKPFSVSGRTYTPEGEPAQAVISFIPSATDKRVKERAENSPYDYMVGTEEELQAAQDKVDAERDPTP